MNLIILIPVKYCALHLMIFSIYGLCSYCLLNIIIITLISTFVSFTSVDYTNKIIDIIYSVSSWFLDLGCLARHL